MRWRHDVTKGQSIIRKNLYSTLIGQFKKDKKGRQLHIFCTEKVKMIKLKLKDREISLPKNSKYLLPGNRSTLNFIPLFGFFSNFENIKIWHFEPFSPPCSILNFFTVFEYFVIFGSGLGILGSDINRENISRVERQKKMDIISSQRSWDYDSLIFTIYHLTHLMNLAMHFFKAGCKF